MTDEHLRAEAHRPGADLLPTGTVTFLFTDIAGSTALLRADREAYASALAEHRRLLRAAFAFHGGREVDTSGDGFFAAFPTAGQAVAAAARAQRALAARPGPDGARLSVRMGLHSGEATVAEEGYVGLAVHRAARIAAAAAGGQVVLSEATAALVADDLPTGTALQPLGEHRLRDFPRAAALFQLDVDGLPTRFPPLRLAAPRHRLPGPPGALLGREADLAALAGLLTDPGTRLVTVTGPGGVGKTRLALEAARTMADTFPGRVVLVPLSAVADPTLVLPTIADAVGARREPGAPPLDAVRSVLGGDRTLLVLDNVEQVVAAAGELAALLDAVPALVVLVTSRRALRLRAERLYPLAPLAAPAAERLFVERAAAVRPGFTVDAANAAAVAGICRRLDGLPLAIELAAARVRLLPPAALLEHLSTRPDVLTGGPVDLPERQRTLRATMDWSFRLLDPHEQAVFARLAVFSGGWTVAAAETVCGRPGEPAVLDALAALLDASLLTESGASGGELRLDMLETVRAYAMEKLGATADRAETGRRHTEWMLAVTAPLMPGRAPAFREAIERLDRERANFRAAVRRAIDAADAGTAAALLGNASPYLARRDAQREAVAWLDQILPRAADAPAGVRARLLLLRAFVSGVLGDIPAARALLAEGRRLLGDDAEEADRIRAAMAGAMVATADGSVEQASRSLDEAAARSAAVGHELGLESVQYRRADLALSRADLEGAERHYRAALQIARRLGDDDALRDLLSTLGLVVLARGNVADGRRWVLEGAEVNRRAGRPVGIAYALEGLAALALVDGRPAGAARALAAAASARRGVAVPLDLALQPLVDDVAAGARERLGDRACAAAWAEGRRWPPLQALRRTLREVADAEGAADAGSPGGRLTDGQR